jgi:hypothetical protein
MYKVERATVLTVACKFFVIAGNDALARGEHAHDAVAHSVVVDRIIKMQPSSSHRTVRVGIARRKRGATMPRGVCSAMARDARDRAATPCLR